MVNTEKYISKLFVFASIYLLTLILGGFFILPGIFGIDDYNFPPALELFLKVTATLAVVIVIASAIIIPAMKLLPQNSKHLQKSPVFAATPTIFLGFIFIFLHGLYVKLKTCAMDDNAWYCNVEGKSYVGMAVLVFFVASILGALTWIVQRLNSKQ